MVRKRFRADVIQDSGSSGCAIELPFDPRDVFGRVRVPVNATLRSHTYRTTICSMGGRYLIPLSKKNREASDVSAGDRVMVTLEEDVVARAIEAPADLKRALARNAPAKRAWDALSFTHKREHVEAIEEAKRADTRERRVRKAVEMLSEAPVATGKKTSRKKTGKKKVSKKKVATRSASSDKVAGVSSDAVKAKTGKTWDQWLKAIDRAGGRTMSHKEIVSYLHKKCGVAPWWSQMVTVGYEQERHGRQVHEKPGGFEVSVSKTIGVGLHELYLAWSDTRRRKRWLDEADFEVRKATTDTSMRITWVDGRTHVDAYFYDKGASKSQVTVQHKKLKSQAQVEEIRGMWRDRLASLKEHLG